MLRNHEEWWVTPDLESGKIWMETKLREISNSLPNPAQALEWQRPEQRTMEQFARGSIGLKVYRGEDYQIVEFLNIELEDVEASPEIQRRLEARIREGMRENRA